MTLVIQGAHIVTGDDADTRHDKADIVVEADRITAISTNAGRQASESGAEVINGESLIAMPGFINAHIHSGEAFQQAVYKNAPLEPWLLEAHSPFGSRLPTAREHYLASMLSGILAIRGGSTTVQDDFIHIAATTEAQDHSIQAYYDLGIRAWAAVDMWDQTVQRNPALRRRAVSGRTQGRFRRPADRRRRALAQLCSSRHFDKWHERDGLIRVHIAPCGPQRVHARTVARDRQALRNSMAIPLHSHCLETKLQAIESRWRHGKSFVEYLADLGDAI